MKLAKIKKFISENQLPKEIRLNQASNITDVAKFFDSHIATMESDGNSRRIRILHYYRVIKVIEMIKEKGLVKVVDVPLEVIEDFKEELKHVEKQDDNFLNVKPSERIGGIKPNTDFENDTTPIYHPVSKPKTAPIVEKLKQKPKKEEWKSDDRQISMF